MRNLNILLFFTVLSATFWSSVKLCSEQSNEISDVCFSLRDDVTEIKEMLRKLVFEIERTNKNIQRSCAGDPPSLRNGKVTDFERSHGSGVRYECDRNFVMTGNSTVLCVSGEWEGHPPNCSYFDATFYAEAAYINGWRIDCHSDYNADKIKFSRAVDTGQGGGLPSAAVLSTSKRSARMDFWGVNWDEKSGGYRCEFLAEGGSMDAVVQYQSGSLHFPDPSEVASVGDNVTIRLFSSYSSRPILWSRDGMRAPSLDGSMKVSFQEVKEEDAAVYTVRYEDKTYDDAIVRLSVRRCKTNLYGERCDQVCPPCYNGGICHDLLGMCVCPQGFVGDSCDTPCPEGFHGPDCSTECEEGKCIYRLFCNPGPYGCYCARGFKSYWCNVACEPGWYGAHCKQPCHCADGPENCNRFTGACSGGCAPGWKGLSCQIRDSNNAESGDADKP